MTLVYPTSAGQQSRVATVQGLVSRIPGAQALGGYVKSKLVGDDPRGGGPTRGKVLSVRFETVECVVVPNGGPGASRLLLLIGYATAFELWDLGGDGVGVGVGGGGGAVQLLCARRGLKHPVRGLCLFGRWTQDGGGMVAASVHSQRGGPTEAAGGSQRRRRRRRRSRLAVSTVDDRGVPTVRPFCLDDNSFDDDDDDDNGEGQGKAQGEEDQGKGQGEREDRTKAKTSAKEKRSGGVPSPAAGSAAVRGAEAGRLPLRFPGEVARGLVRVEGSPRLLLVCGQAAIWGFSPNTLRRVFQCRCFPRPPSGLRGEGAPVVALGARWLALPSDKRPAPNHAAGPGSSLAARGLGGDGCGGGGGGGGGEGGGGLGVDVVGAAQGVVGGLFWLGKKSSKAAADKYRDYMQPRQPQPPPPPPPPRADGTAHAPPSGERGPSGGGGAERAAAERAAAERAAAVEAYERLVSSWPWAGCAGSIAVLDVGGGEGDEGDEGEGSRGWPVAHFQAHGGGGGGEGGCGDGGGGGSGGGVGDPIAALAWNRRGDVLLSAPASGQTLHLWAVAAAKAGAHGTGGGGGASGGRHRRASGGRHGAPFGSGGGGAAALHPGWLPPSPPHPPHPPVPCVFALRYKLVRGLTPAAVVAAALSPGSLWAAATTAKGTTHVWAVDGLRGGDPMVSGQGSTGSRPGQRSGHAPWDRRAHNKRALLAAAAAAAAGIAHDAAAQAVGRGGARGGPGPSGGGLGGGGGEDEEDEGDEEEDFDFVDDDEAPAADVPCTTLGSIARVRHPSVACAFRLSLDGLLEPAMMGGHVDDPQPHGQPQPRLSGGAVAAAAGGPSSTPLPPPPPLPPASWSSPPPPSLSPQPPPSSHGAASWLPPRPVAVACAVLGRRVLVATPDGRLSASPLLAAVVVAEPPPRHPGGGGSGALSPSPSSSWSSSRGSSLFRGSGSNNNSLGRPGGSYSPVSASPANQGGGGALLSSSPLTCALHSLGAAASSLTGSAGSAGGGGVLGRGGVGRGSGGTRLAVEVGEPIVWDLARGHEEHTAAAAAAAGEDRYAGRLGTTSIDGRAGHTIHGGSSKTAMRGEGRDFAMAPQAEALWWRPNGGGRHTHHHVDANHVGGGRGGKGESPPPPPQAWLGRVERRTRPSPRVPLWAAPTVSFATFSSAPPPLPPRAAAAAPAAAAAVPTFLEAALGREGGGGTQGRGPWSSWNPPHIEDRGPPVVVVARRPPKPPAPAPAPAPAVAAAWPSAPPVRGGPVHDEEGDLDLQFVLTDDDDDEEEEEDEKEGRGAGGHEGVETLRPSGVHAAAAPGPSGGFPW